jgi:hypothetical protein
MLVQLGAGQEVCQRVVDAGPVASLYEEVVSEGGSVELSEQASERLAACALSIDDVHVGAVVDEKEERLSCEKGCVGSRAGDYRQQLAPCYLSMRMVEVCVFRRVAPAECSPYPEVLGPRSQRRNIGGDICSDIHGDLCGDIPGI